MGFDAFTPTTSDYPSNTLGPAVAVSATSGNVANGVAAATLAAATGRTCYLTSFEVTGLGATAAATVIAQVGGIQGSANMQYVISVPAGVGTPITPLIVQFPKPLPGPGVGQSMGVSVPAFGAGNTNVAVNAHGYVL